jgi:hypothetical protein
MDRAGEHQQAREVRDYAYERANHNRGLEQRVRDNWPGNR